MTKQTLHEGRFLQMISADGWEFVERVGATGVVAILAVTDDERIVLVEQFRPPIGKRVIEIPAGLAGDLAGAEQEALELAARRELEEETGYSADGMHEMETGPSSAGLTSELITFFEATGLEKTSGGGGDGSESIVVHEVQLTELRTWLADQVSNGAMIDPKVHAALCMAGRTLAR